MTFPRGKWTLEEALDVIRSLNVCTRAAGYYVGLTGSVLHKGKSHNDLDLLLVPLSDQQLDYDRLVGVLRDFGMTLVVDKERVHARWRKVGSNDTKHVEIWSYKGKKIDCIFVK